MDNPIQPQGAGHPSYTSATPISKDINWGERIGKFIIGILSCIVAAPLWSTTCKSWLQEGWSGKKITQIHIDNNTQTVSAKTDLIAQGLLVSPTATSSPSAQTTVRSSTSYPSVSPGSAMAVSAPTTPTTPITSATSTTSTNATTATAYILSPPSNSAARPTSTTPATSPSSKKHTFRPLTDDNCKRLGQLYTDCESGRRYNKNNKDDESLVIHDFLQRCATNNELAEGLLYLQFTKPNLNEISLFDKQKECHFNQLGSILPLLLGFKQLQSLTLSNCGVTDSVVREIGQHAPHTLTELWIDNNPQLSGSTFDQLPTTLKNIGLSSCAQLTPEGIQKLPQCTWCNCLESTSTPAHVKELPASIQTLSIGNFYQFNDTHIKELQHLSQLKELTLVTNSQGDTLSSLPNNIQTLDISSCENFTADNVLELLKSHPTIRSLKVHEKVMSRLNIPRLRNQYSKLQITSP